MQRPVVDYSMGRSFTTANGPAVRKYANAPIVNKIEEYVQVRGCGQVRYANAPIANKVGEYVQVSGYV
eukprot:1159903-Pelagomonas_calceolata.AAC.2